MKIILVDGRLTPEKLAQILKRHAPRRRKETKTTLADVWPGKEKEDVTQSSEDSSPQQ